MVIAIIKYGMGNVASVQKAIKKIGFTSVITDSHEEIINSDVILLPGVGSFEKGMANLKASGLVDLLTEEVINNKKPFIGICLGMQLLASFGNEPERIKGLGWIEGEVVKIISPKKYRIPHLGWNSVNSHTHDYSMFNNKDFYFIHSYHFKPKKQEEVIFTVNYDLEMVAGLQKENIHAFQFHPEKSQTFGIELLGKILNKYA